MKWTCILLSIVSAVFAFERKERELGMIQYGKWCGAGHGGYQDCGPGGLGPSPACVVNTTTGLTRECLEDCPPLDALDLQCAEHDYMTFALESPIPCSPQGNFCGADCILAQRALKVECESSSCSLAQKAIVNLFTHGLSCWYYFEHSKIPKCDGIVSGGQPLENFCPQDLNPLVMECVAQRALPQAKGRVAQRTLHEAKGSVAQRTVASFQTFSTLPENSFCDFQNNATRFLCLQGFEADPETGKCF
jgi:hypothetical protein